jgi:hypothetical protein
MPQDDASIEVLTARTERMRQECLAYQIEHHAADDSGNAMVGEIDCLVELEMLKLKAEGEP